MTTRRMFFPQSSIPGLLDGSITQRRIPIATAVDIKTYPIVEYARDGLPIFWSSLPCDEIRNSDYYDHGMPSPFGPPGDRLWVPETWRSSWHEDGEGCPCYRADNLCGCGRLAPIRSSGLKWRSPATMPREWVRLILEVLAVRVERLQAITFNDVPKETLPTVVRLFRRREFTEQWDATHHTSEHLWAANPRVWVGTFKRLEENP